MKKNLAIALATGLAATTAVIYFVMKRKRKLAEAHTEKPPVYHEKTHHLTNAFANAKKHAMHVS